MMNRWRTATVSELQRDGILLVEDGNHGESRPRPDEFGDKGVAFIRAADMNGGRVLFDSASRINDQARRRITKGIGARGDVLLSHKGTVGKVAIVPNDAPSFVCSPQTTFWRTLDDRNLDRRYLYAYLRSPMFHAQLATRAGETDMAPYVSLTSQRGLSVLLPPIPVQRAIGRIIGALDDKIEVNRQMNETLEAMARTLFKSWFVDFDPVRAKAEGRDPGLPKAIADLFPDRFVESELGEIPEGWPLSPLAEHFYAVKGVSYKGSGLAASGTPLHNLNSIYEGGGYKYEGIKHYNGEYSDRHMIVPGDVIVANTEQGHDRLLIGYAAIVPSAFGAQGIASHHIYRLRPRAGTPLTAAFLCHLLNSQRMHETVSGYANGTTVNMLPLDGVQSPLTICPPARLVTMFDAFATNSERRREKAILESRTLTDLRNTLLPKLISGELRVKEATEQISEATEVEPV